jgi:hypothetical protein
MRFSLKGILIGVTYVAIAAAAFTQTTWVYADILWAVALLAVVYSALMAAFLRGRRQIAAAGFVVGCFCFLLCLTLGGDAVPTTRILVAAGVGQVNGQSPTVTAAPATGTWALMPTNPGNVTSYASASSSYNATLGTTVVAAPANPQLVASGSRWAVAAPTGGIAPTAPPIDFGIYVRAGNAVGMVLIGLAGSVIGAMVHRAGRCDAAA